MTLPKPTAGSNPKLKLVKGDALATLAADMRQRGHHLSSSQRAMVGARVFLDSANKLRAKDIASVLDISYDSIRVAVIVLEKGTPEEIEAADAGTLGINPTARDIRMGYNAEQRKQRNDLKKSGVPKRGRISSLGIAVYSRMAAGEKPPVRMGKRGPYKTRLPVPEPVPEPPPVPVQPSTPIFYKEPSVGDYLIYLIRLSRNVSVSEIAETLIRDTLISTKDLDKLALWILELEDEHKAQLTERINRDGQ